MCYPHGVWFQGVQEGDVPEIETRVRKLLEGDVARLDMPAVRRAP